MHATSARTAAGCLALTLFLAGCAEEPPPIVTWTELAQTGHQATGVRFARLDPTSTGIDFAHELSRQHVLPYLYNGGGVAIADYDDDGMPDVYLVSQDGQNRLYRQTAPWQFEDVTIAAGGLDGGDAWGNAATFVDIDNDGDLDLYVCNLEAPNLLYQNRGDGTFDEVAGKFGLAIVAASTGAAFADYDNDGDLDLYLLTNRVLGPTVPEQLISDLTPPGDTRKQPEEFLPRARPKVVVAAGQRRIEEKFRDLYFAMGNHVFAAGQADRLYRQDGYAQFTDVTDRAGISDQGMGLSATWWDYDDDGWLDLYVANDLESPDLLYHNRRDGTFEDVTKTALPHTAYFGMGSDFGDVDGDGNFDLIVADMSSRTHYMSKLLMGNMGDRRWFLENAEPPQYMRNALYLGTGTEHFLEASFLAGLASTDWTWAVRFADLDNDTRIDLFATNGIPRFDNDPDANPEFRRLWRSGRREAALAFARTLPAVRERNLCFRNLGGLDFENTSERWGLDEEGVSHGAALADLDRDGDLDVVINNFNAPASVYRNDTRDGRGLLVQLVGDPSNRHGVGARLKLLASDGTTQIRIVTIARGYLGSGEAVSHFGMGATEDPATLHIRWPSGIEQTVEEVVAGRHYTIREHASQPIRTPATTEDERPLFEATEGPVPFRHQEAEFDDYALQPLLPRRLSRSGPGLAWGDANGDEHDDLWIGGAAGQSGRLLISNGPDVAQWQPMHGPWEKDSIHDDQGAVWLDFDSDGDLDLFVVSGGIEVSGGGTDQPELRDRLYRNLDGRRFVRASDALPSDMPAFSGSCAAAADWDRDGDVDLFLGGHTVAARFPQAPPSVLLRNDGGTFVDATAECAVGLGDAGMVTAATWTDLDDDGFVDLVVAAHWQPIRIWWNRDGERLTRTGQPGLDDIRGLWNGLTSADLDGDGDFDLVVTNLGHNSKYHASQDHPLEIFADDFGDPDGVLDIIEAKHSGGQLLPVRGKSCSTAAMPFLGDKFRTFKSFARASLTEIYTDDALAGAEHHVAATELATVVFENTGQGQFAMRPLPKLAQIAPGYGVVVADFDADYAVDIAIAQNSFSPEPETGRLDGGLGILLRGSVEGHLEFAPVPVPESGLSIRGDQQALALGDFDRNATPDLVFSINDEPPRAFLGRDPTINSVLRVQLVGPPGNPAAIGARVILQRGDITQTAEVHAGDSYLSQSTAMLVFVHAPGEASLAVRWPDGETTRHDLSQVLVDRPCIARVVRR